MSPEEQLAGFIAKYSPEIQEQAAVALKKMRARLPGAVEMVYDNYNALVCGFGPSERTSEAIFSIALYPRYLTLFFLHGAALPDPDTILEGAGSQVRGIRLKTAEDLDRPEFVALMRAAIGAAPVPFNAEQPYRLVIKSISAKQRSRIPR